MSEKEEKERPSLMLQVKVRLEQFEEKELPEVMVYAFDQTGQFVSSSRLVGGEVCEAKLELPRELLGETVRIFVGPPMVNGLEEIPKWMEKRIRVQEGLREEPSPSLLLRKGAYEKRVKLYADREILDATLFPHDWARLFKCKCVVRGKLVRRFTLPDGTTKELGVCHACVKIYEVDKASKIILALSDQEIVRLRDDLKYILQGKIPEIKVWPPIPPPPPPPPVERRFMRGSPNPANTDLESEMNVKLLPEKTKVELEPIFLATSNVELRKALIDKAAIILQLACVLEWLWYKYTKDLIKCVCTDEQGRFETTIWYTCGGDKPDLYFKAVQCIDGLHTVYDPGVACNTYWNYECGKEVILEVTDPAARVCVPPPDVTPPPGVALWVMPYAVGGIRLDNIKQPSGLTDYGGIVDAPFGGRLGFRHGYSSAIPINMPNKPFYYRWRYKKEGTSDWHEFVEPWAEPVVRHYVDEDLSKPSEPPTFPAYTLGPKSVNGMHLYEFKPHNPPQPAGHKTMWPVDDWFGDIYTGIMKSPNLPGGVDVSAEKYKIKLDIFDPAGNRIAPAPGTFQFIVPTGIASDGKTITTRYAYPSEIEDDGFVFYLHIDNRKCEAIVDAPSIGTELASDECGFLRYKQNDPTPVHIAFHALHPANFATLRFLLKRGYITISNVVGETDALSIDLYLGDGNGNFDRDFATGDLLGVCPEAAFSEVLDVYAKATNGWVRLDQYDDRDVRAFALAKAKGKASET